MVSRASPEGRVVLRNRELGVRRGGTTERRELDDDAILDALRRHFDIDMPEGTRFRCFEGAEPTAEAKKKS